jgi:hypothetical protein
MITWKKIGNIWMVYGPPEEVKVGVVTVHRKDGTTSQEEVINVSPSAVLWKGKAMALGEIKPKPRKERGGRNGKDDIPPLSKEEASMSICDQCGNRGGRYHRVDSSGLPGLVCYRCCRTPQCELSFG